MKTNNSPIKVNETFMRLMNGAVTMNEIISERSAVNAARQAREDAYTRRHRELAEAADPFAVNYCR